MSLTVKFWYVTENNIKILIFYMRSSIVELSTCPVSVAGNKIKLIFGLHCFGMNYERAWKALHMRV